jgi:hypothetical membrane protein
MKKLIKLLPLSGALGVVFYFLHILLGTPFYEGYDSTAQAISDLTASNSPSRNIAMPFTVIYGIFTVIFSTYFFVYFRQKINKCVTFGAGFFCIMTIVSFLGYIFFPLSEAGYAGTFQDKMHLAVTIIVVLFTITALILFIIGFFRTEKLKYLAVISLCTFLLLLSGSILINILPKKYLGITGCINVFSIVIYTGILSFWMYKNMGKDFLPDGALKRKWNEKTKITLFLTIFHFIIVFIFLSFLPQRSIWSAGLFVNIISYYIGGFSWLISIIIISFCINGLKHESKKGTNIICLVLSSIYLGLYIIFFIMFFTVPWG